MRGLAARAPTSSALRFPGARGAGATPLPRSARRLAAAALLCLAGALGGCEPYVQGNGVYYEETRPDVGPFTGLHVESGVEVTVTAGAAARSVTVSGDANVVPYIETKVQTDSGLRVLHVWISRAYGGTFPPRAVVEVPALEYAYATELARIKGDEIAATSFQVVADHGGNVALAGASAPAGESIGVKLGTGGLLDATGYAVSNAAQVELSGASVARLRSDGPVSGTVTDRSQLDNLQGTGGCTAVVADGSSTIRCPP